MTTTSTGLKCRIRCSFFLFFLRSNIALSIPVALTGNYKGKFISHNVNIPNIGKMFSGTIPYGFMISHNVGKTK